MKYLEANIEDLSEIIALLKDDVFGKTRELCIAVPFMKIKRFTMNVYSESILSKTAEKKD